ERGADELLRFRARDLPAQRAHAVADAGDRRGVSRAREAAAVLGDGAHAARRPRGGRRAALAGGAGRLPARTRHPPLGSGRLLIPNARTKRETSQGAWRCTKTASLPCAVMMTSWRRRATARTICRAALGVGITSQAGTGSAVASWKRPVLSTRRISEST